MNRMFKIAVCLLIISIMSSPLVVHADSGLTDIINQNKNTSVDSEISKKLEDVGFKDITVDSMKNLDLSKIFNVLIDSLVSTVRDPLKILPVLISSIILLNITELSCFDYIKKSSFIFSVFKTSIIGTITIGFLTKSIYKAVTALKICNTFSASLVPIYYLIILASAKPTGASAFQNIMLIFCNIFSSVITYIIVPIVAMCCALSFAKSISKSSFLHSLQKFLGSIIKLGITVFMSVFAAAVTVKTSIGAATDTISGKLTKAVISSTVPVIGGYISDSLTALKGTVSILKNGMGIYAATVVILIILPSFIELLLYSFVFKIADTVHIVNDTKNNMILSSLSECLSLITVTQIAAVLMYIFSFSVALSGV